MTSNTRISIYLQKCSICFLEHAIRTNSIVFHEKDEVFL